MKNLKTLVASIEASNKEFSKMTPAEKRVAIAQDCIDRINLGQLRGTTGTVIDVSCKFDYGDSLKDLLSTKTKSLQCSVCAKGGLFMSYIGRVNEFTFNDLDYTNTLNGSEMEKLKEIFNWEQLSLIETAFEGQQYTGKLTYEDVETAEKFYDRFSQDTRRLKEICKNIVKNKGTFVV